MFKIGEIVYYTRDSKLKIKVKDHLILDTPYIIETTIMLYDEEDEEDYQWLMVDDGSGRDILYYYEAYRFISEQEYKIKQRLNKIKKIKDAIH